MSLWSILGTVGGGVLGSMVGMPTLGASLGASLGGALDGNNATNKAADAQVTAGNNANATQLQAQREALAFQQKQADQARADQQPWRDAGANALTSLTAGTQPGGQFMTPSTAFSKPFQFQADPGYDFRQAEGMKGITNSAAARGNLLSGAALKAASQYNQNLASNEYQNAYSRYQGSNTDQFNRDQTTATNGFNKLASISQIGQISANQTAANGMQLGGQVGNALMNTGQDIAHNQLGIGNVRASSYLANNNTTNNGINQAISAWNNRPTASGGNALMPWNQYSGGNDGWTNHDGESLST